MSCLLSHVTYPLIALYLGIFRNLGSSDNKYVLLNWQAALSCYLGGHRDQDKGQTLGSHFSNNHVDHRKTENETRICKSTTVHIVPSVITRPFLLQRIVASQYQFKNNCRLFRSQVYPIFFILQNELSYKSHTKPPNVELTAHLLLFYSVKQYKRQC